MAHRSHLYSTLVAVAVVVATLATGSGVSAAPVASQPDQLLRAWTDAVAVRGIAVPKARYELSIGNWKGIPGRSWVDVVNHRLYLSPEVERDARDTSFPQGRREMRLQLLHELGHALDAELSDPDRSGYAAIMDDHRPWTAEDGDRVDVEEPPNERFAVAYSAVAAGLPYNRLRPEYGLRPTRSQYKRLARYFRTLGSM